MPVSPSRITPPAPASPVSAPTADAGSNQQVDGRPTVTLDGSGSTAGSTFAWTLFDPSGADVTSLLSSATAESPTFKPKDVPPGNYTATIAVTKGGVTSKDSANVQVGIDGGKWLRLVPAEADSTYDSGNYSGSETWTDDGTYTSVAIGSRTAAINDLTDCQILWFNSSITNCTLIQNIEFKILLDPTFAQPDSTLTSFIGICFGDTTTVTDSETMYAVFRTDDQTPADATRCSVKAGGTVNMAWQNTQAGYDTMYGLSRGRMGRGQIIKTSFSKYSTASGLGANTGEIDQSTNCLWGTDALRVGLVVGRQAVDASTVTIKAAISYRVTLRAAP